MYGVNHPQNEVFYNQVTLLTIVSSTGLGSPAQLLDEERNLRPDITDVSALSVFEIKPLGEQGRQEGRQEVHLYVAALNRAVAPGWRFAPGVECQGEMLIRFAQGQYIWRLEWQTPEPGVVQYRWTRSQQRFESAAQASDAGQWVVLTEQEMRRYGGWVGQAVEDMVKHREQLASFSGAVGFVIDIIGEGARGVLAGVIFGRMNSGSGAKQPPGQSGGKVIPFPSRAPPASPAAPLPAAVGR